MSRGAVREAMGVCEGGEGVGKGGPLPQLWLRALTLLLDHIKANPTHPVDKQALQCILDKVLFIYYYSFMYSYIYLFFI